MKPVANRLEDRATIRDRAREHQEPVQGIELLILAVLSLADEIQAQGEAIETELARIDPS